MDTHNASLIIIDTPVVDAATSDTVKDIMLKYYAAGRIKSAHEAVYIDIAGGTVGDKTIHELTMVCCDSRGIVQFESEEQLGIKRNYQCSLISRV